jgi:hypothetical protein
MPGMASNSVDKILSSISKGKSVMIEIQIMI